MVAVGAVFVNHLSGHPKGAFTGVDVFFVISGFLITQLLIRDASSDRMTIRRYFANFYARRARRILPASSAVLISSLVAAMLTFTGVRVQQARTDVLWAVSFAANIHSARVGVDYFQQGRAPSITQHFWSLAVEEQFYFIWPVILLTSFAMLKRCRRTTSLLSLLSVVTVISAASFTYAVHDSTMSPTTAYFSTFARAWELGVGAMLAVALTLFPRKNSRKGRWRGPVFAIGLATIVVSFFVVDPGSGFPAPWGALPVLATALTVFAGPTKNVWSWVLTNRISVYVGEISYSLYLWHWPVIIITSALVRHGSVTYYFTAVSASLALSVFSYEFIETPLRTRRKSTSREIEHRPRARTALVAALLAVIALGSYTLRPVPAAPDFTGFASAGTSLLGSQSANNVAPVTFALTRQIAAALAQTSFPAFSPDLGSLSLSNAETDWASCDGDGTIRRSCVFPSPHLTAPRSKRVVVLGDSISLAWLPAIRSALEPRGYKIFGLAKQQCSAAFTHENIYGKATPNIMCDRQHELFAQAERDIDPGMVIMSSSEGALNAIPEKSTAGYQAGMTKTARIFANSKVFILSPPPLTGDLPVCDTGGASPADCVKTQSPTWLKQSQADANTARATKARYIDTYRWFCSSNGYCPAFVGRTPVTYDGEHLTKAYSKRLGMQLVRALMM